ncbi:basic leucine zipper 34-like [Vicia villosa]|uniref:basic leucine zipper 34-like n=1 Tax=Vicia villosa TaxID=3911 RepID=UPI00273C3887|nr:basic leucine zipper 34-like [Vicia villosa]
MQSSNSEPNLRDHSQFEQTFSLPPKSKMSSSNRYDEIGGSCLDGLISELGGTRLNHRTYSDSLLSEPHQHQQQDVPYWLNDLLEDDDEPEEGEKPPRSHRRSSSDSIAFLHNRNILLQDSDRKEHIINVTNPQLAFLHQQHPRIDPSKRVRRHSAQQYRARKVQYIGELERSVQSLQAEGYEVSAELEFLDQQNLILGMENRALKQRLDSLSQEHFIKCLEQEVLEKEISRLRNLYQQQQHRQQQQQQKHNGRNRSKRQDIDSSIAKLSLKNKGTESSQKAI